jgi:hypothetical protein
VFLFLLCVMGSEGDGVGSNRPMKRRRLATSLGHFFDAEQVQEQEQEREQQQEQEVSADSGVRTN